MSEEPINFVLEWRESQERRGRQTRDEFAQLSAEAATAAEVVAEPESQPANVPPETFQETPPEPEPEPDESPEFFEWTADRERAIQRFLETAPEGALPTVHVQLTAIHQALKHGNLDPKQAMLLLDEVDGYLAERISAEERKVPVADAAFLMARGDKLKAFYAFLEASGAMREFLASGETVQLDVAAYAADQGTAFLAGARQLIFDAEPPEEP
ncbi:MAG: hypothetical protein KF760_33885 [Candidatus Eremiobacteraeota bacterium]|nr:hypothetical protein [Candidatus Eremiobacteraeota bacterium]MCW5871518.1 hypothetical protein [Candidatus Eremiobacteraeota bacterium]